MLRIYAAVAALVGLVGLVAWLAVAKVQAESALASERLEHVQAAFEKQARDLETLAKVQRERSIQLEQTKRTADALRVDRDGLRDSIAAYAGQADAACGERAAELGRLLVDGLRVQDELAQAAEDRLADARALRDQRIEELKE